MTTASAPSLRHPMPSAFPELSAWSPDLFAHPTAIFRGAPFWSWNGKLDRDRLLQQFRTFDAMGIGGGHVHARTGLEDAYLGDDFMDHVVAMADEAERRDMLLWLYDEDRWPSGFGGGMVTQDPALRCRHLLLTRTRPVPGETRMHPIHHGPDQPVTDRSYVAAWAMRFDGHRLLSWRRIDEDEDVARNEVSLYAYVEVAPDWSWFNHQQYANLLDPSATQRFIEVTHERYARALGDRFGKTIPAIFTDEPLFRGMDQPASFDDPRDLRIAWVDDLPGTYRKQFGDDVLDTLPAVLFDAADGSSPQTRWRFHDHHTQRFVDGFAAPLGRWCEDHGLALTGHLMEEPRLASQSRWVGEVMRSLRHFQLPGIDMLCDFREYTTAKQAQSVARQCGRPGVLSELYGVTHWDFPFAGHLRQGNWQAALGVTVRVHHLTWYSMAGEAKRDYPASIGRHMPWWSEYPAVEDHFARVAVALQTGRPVCRVAMLHPIESHWVAEGPTTDHAEDQAMLERGFAETLSTLLEGQIDADLIAESLLEELCPGQASHPLTVGEMTYEAVVLPPLLTMRATTLARLESFVEAGGTVISLGTPPKLVDALPSDAAIRAAERWLRCDGDPQRLLSAVMPWRDVELRNNFRRIDGAVYQLREEDEGRRILFICSTRKASDFDSLLERESDYDGLTLRIRGRWRVEHLDTRTGESVEPGEAWTDDGWTALQVDLPIAAHLLLRLHPADAPKTPCAKTTWREHARLQGPMPITLSEPNVLVLDRPAWRLDEGDWQPCVDVLRADNLARAGLGMPLRSGEIAQPWIDPATPTGHRITVRYTVRSDVTVEAPLIALERLAAARITLDGHAIPSKAAGFYVDEDIPTVALPSLAVGDHTLEIEWPVDARQGLEACYLLGDFGVTVAGTEARITAPPRELSFGDWTNQGLPFYGGNVTYHCRLNRPVADAALHVPRFAAPLLALDSDGKRLGLILAKPFRLVLPAGKPGPMSLDITCFGDRVNTFGTLHNSKVHERWCGPPAWRTEGEEWTDGYVIRPSGLLVEPIIEVS